MAGIGLTDFITPKNDAFTGMVHADQVIGTEGTPSGGTLLDTVVAESNVTQHEAAIDHDGLLNFVVKEHIDWTADAGADNIHVNNIVNLVDANVSISAAINATKIGNGDVNNTELSFISTLTENVQTALDAAIYDSDFSPAEGFLRKTGAGAYTAHKSNLSASSAPGATDDSAAGYSVGSLWIDTTADKSYICVDATASSAVWNDLTAGGGGGEANTASNSGTDGVGVFDQKVGVDLEFRHIASTNSLLTVALDATDDDIDLTVNEANITHDNLIAGTIASHDTTATGANLNTLTNASNADALHVHEGTAIKSTGEAGGTKFLREDGDGTCSWQAAPAGGSPGGASGDVQYNDGASGFAADSDLNYDGTHLKIGATTGTNELRFRNNNFAIYSETTTTLDIEANNASGDQIRLRTWNGILMTLIDNQVTIGDGGADDFSLRFNASVTTGTLTWDQDPGTFLFDNDVDVNGNITLAGGGTVDGVDISAHAADVDAHHNRSHAMTGTSDHTASNWKLFASNGAGQVTEIAHGATSGHVLTSNGAAAAPTWQAAAGGGSPGGASGDVQYNDGASGFAGTDDFNYDGTDLRLGFVTDRDKKIAFRDSTIFLHSSASSTLHIEAPVIEMEATTTVYAVDDVNDTMFSFVKSTNTFSIGGGKAATDYKLRFDGATQDGTFTYDDSEDSLDWDTGFSCGNNDTDIVIGAAGESTGADLYPAVSGNWELGRSDKLWLKIWTTAITIRQAVNATVSNPPTDAQLDTIFTSPAAIADEVCFLEDTTDNDYWLVVSDGTYFYTVEMARAV